MMRGDEIDIGLRLLDHQLVASDDVRCGKVDDVLLEPVDGELRVSMLLSGPRAQRRRLPRGLARVARWIGRDVEHRVPWEDVTEIEAAVQLKPTSIDLGLAAGDRNAADLIPKWLPRS